MTHDQIQRALRAAEAMRHYPAVPGEFHIHPADWDELRFRLQPVAEGRPTPAGGLPKLAGLTVVVDERAARLPRRVAGAA